MMEFTPYILALFALIMSIFGFFIKNEMNHNKEEMAQIKKENSELLKNVRALEKTEQRLLSDLGHAIETMHDIKDKLEKYE